MKNLIPGLEYEKSELEPKKFNEFYKILTKFIKSINY